MQNLSAFTTIREGDTLRLSPQLFGFSPLEGVMLTQGNLKLGNGVWHWNLPAGSLFSCPGASAWCDASLNGGCYANPTKHRRSYGSAHVQAIYQKNWEDVQGDCSDWALRMSAWIQTKNRRARHLRNQVRVVRIHTSGDFFSPSYIAMWTWIADCNPSIKFYAYTRSWAVPELLPLLEEFRRLPNVTLWASTDHAMDRGPITWPEANVVLRDGVMPYPMVRCPEQTGKQPDCTTCGLCWHPKLTSSTRLVFTQH
jgi:hypothetical protein